jgi:hypothetical protein
MLLLGWSFYEWFSGAFIYLILTFGVLPATLQSVWCCWVLVLFDEWFFGSIVYYEVTFCNASMVLVRLIVVHPQEGWQ